MDLYSLPFFVFLFIVISIYFLAPKRFRWVVLLAASYYFYGTFKIQYVFILAFSTIIAYSSALLMERQPSISGKRKILLAGCVCNLGILFLFKYYNFFSDSIAIILNNFNLSYQGHLILLVVPVGISFYIFQVVSYMIDVYRGTKSAERHLGLFALYVSFFPKLLAGPIERAKQFLPQLHEYHQWDWERATNGFKLMVWGLFKKMVVADRLAVFVDTVFNNPNAYEGPSLALASVFYSFQIYCDFSGYTDIAIGISQIFGFRLNDNFDRPYVARSVAEFWRRWHISFSTWLRDYLYIPLGGNRVVPARLYGNLMVVFLVCGLWHGASWTFVVWGFIHGIFLVNGIAFRNIRSRISHTLGLDSVPVIHRYLQICITFILVSLAWIFFRANSLHDALYAISHLHTGWIHIFKETGFESMILLGRPKSQFIIVLASLAFVWLIHFIEDHNAMRRMLSEKPFYLRWPVYYVMLIAVLLLSAPGSQKYITSSFKDLW
jgi:D-alanyl-lipoteichoic acid acyltransferase DltB (MBOAT superfamily)